MKNTQSEIKPIKIGQRPRKKVKMTNKVLREKPHCVACQSNKPRFLKQKIINNWCYKIRWRITAWSVEKIQKILTQKWLEQKTTLIIQQNALFVELKSQDL